MGDEHRNPRAIFAFVEDLSCFIVVGREFQPRRLENGTFVFHQIITIDCGRRRKSGECIEVLCISLAATKTRSRAQSGQINFSEMLAFDRINLHDTARVFHVGANELLVQDLHRRASSFSGTISFHVVFSGCSSSIATKRPRGAFKSVKKRSAIRRFRRGGTRHRTHPAARSPGWRTFPGPCSKPAVSGRSLAKSKLPNNDHHP